MNHPIRKGIRYYFSKKVTPFWAIMFIDCLVVVFSGLASSSMCASIMGIDATDFLMDHLWPLLGSWSCYLLFFLIGFRVFHTYSGVIRYSTVEDLSRVASANLLAIALIFLVRHLTGIDRFLHPITWQELLGVYVGATILSWLMRILAKVIYDVVVVGNGASNVFIYGVQSGGVSIAKAIVTGEKIYGDLVGFVSDGDSSGHELMGVPIYPNDEQLVAYMRRKNADTLIVSPLKIDAFRENAQMQELLLDAGIHIMIIPDSQEWDGKQDLRASSLREVAIEDLLPRNKIEVDMDSIRTELQGKCIMITGAAGSIGSEIVRQVASFGPWQLVLVDQAETPLHDIRLMLARKFADIPAVTVTASITHRHHMECLFEKYHPQYVFHAAAYKHVPMMEDNPGEAIINNVEGTRIMADLAVKYGAEKFVMVSTDKAVNPTNVMGCSKRICEMYCQSMDKAIKEGSIQGVTQFVTTRFGNVLGSNGSVIPIFREQLKAGGPITVTHPEIIRFFMLIPEACNLVLQAGTMGKGSEIFVFDMGKPVKIADLAKRMISLSGARDVEIKYTGLRDGEKLYEEVLSKEENTKPSSHPKIKIASVREVDYAEVNDAISDMVAVTMSSFSDFMAIVKKMKELVPEFKSKNSIFQVLDD